MYRRGFLAVVGTGVLAGCGVLGSGQQFERASNAFENIQQDQAGPVSTYSATAALESGTYSELTFRVNEQSRFSASGEVRTNGPIDVFLLTPAQLQRFKREPDRIGITQSLMEQSGTESIDLNRTLENGAYTLVLDNTHVGETMPSGAVELQFDVRIESLATPSPNSTDNSSG